MWYKTIKTAILNPLWQYFDPDSKVVFPEPTKPTTPQPKAPPKSPSPQSLSLSTRNIQTVAAETAEQQVAKEARYDKALTMYATCLNIYHIKKKDWDNYHTLVTKLCKIIQGLVASQKVAKLWTELSVRAWLRDLRASTAPAKTATQRSILVEYTNFIYWRHTK